MPPKRIQPTTPLRVTPSFNLSLKETVIATLGILDRLTQEEDFDELAQEFAELIENSVERIDVVVSVVYEKAVNDPVLTAACAKMVHCVTKNSKTTSKIFRKKILDQSQIEFQVGTTTDLKQLEVKLSKAPAEQQELIKLEIEEEKAEARRQSLGNIGFIGELYKLSMVTPKIMVECVDMLLENGDELSYERLCKLLTAVGQLLEDQLFLIGRKPGKWVPDPNFMNKTFSKLNTLSLDTSLSSGIRLALRDIYRLRDYWEPRGDMEVPKTTDEVHRKPNIALRFSMDEVAAARAEEEEAKQLRSLPPTQSSAQCRDGLMSQFKTDGSWNTLSSNKPSRFAQVQNPASDKTPGGEVKFDLNFGSWDRGPSDVEAGGCVESSEVQSVVFTETVSALFQQIQDSLELIKTLEPSDIPQRSFLLSLYGKSALDRKKLPQLTGTRPVLPDTAKNILRKNVYYLAASTKHVDELIQVTNQRGILTAEDRKAIEDAQSTRLKSIALFICFVKKPSSELPYSLLLEILMLSGNSKTAQILSENMPSNEPTPVPTLAVVGVVEAKQDVPTEGAVGGSDENLKVEEPSGWNCKHCTFINPESAVICSMCSKSQNFKIIDSSRVCETCTFINKPGLKICEMCTSSLQLDPSVVSGEDEDDWLAQRGNHGSDSDDYFD